MERALEAIGVSKAFGTKSALRDVSALFSIGEIHAVIGENGAGKTTLMKILSGELKPDAGTIESESDSLRVGMVHQHFMLAQAMTVAENFALASDSKSLLCNPEADGSKAKAIADDLGWSIDLDASVQELSVGAQQRIELLKVLALDRDILIFDEPTAVLSKEEVVELFDIFRRLIKAGKSVILIAHKLSEVLEIADRVTVLRHGKVVGAGLIADLNSSQLAHWMVGEMPQSSSTRVRLESEVIVKTEQVSIVGSRGNIAVSGASLEIRSGEILGIGGVDGNGQIELAEALVGIRPFQGTIKKPTNTAYVPPDRHHDGLALRMSVSDNLFIGVVESWSGRRFGWLDPKAVRSWALGLVQSNDIRVGSINDPAWSLSGGNQQKLLIARALDQQPEFLVAVNPIRGLDLAATSYVHQRLKELADNGAAIALFSTDLDEIALVADRAVFMSSGAIFEELSAEAYLGGTG